MNKFPEHLKPENKCNFSHLKYEMLLSNMREKIFELVLSGNENNYFEVDNFSRMYKLKKCQVDEMIITVTKELEQLGWKIKTSFGGTGLFIYSTDIPPPSCFEE